MNGITVQQRIANVKQFLVETAPEDTQLNQLDNAIPTAGGEIMPPVDAIPLGSSPFLDELKKMNVRLESMEMQQILGRLRFEKDNAVAGDINVHDWAEADVPVGAIVRFNILIPEGWVFHCKWVNCTFADDTTYTFTWDGQYEPPLSEFIMDYADHYRTFEPPIRCYAQAQITALNLGDQENTYSVFYGGFLRRYKRTTQIMSEETSIVEKSTTGGGA